MGKRLVLLTMPIFSVTWPLKQNILHSAIRGGNALRVILSIPTNAIHHCMLLVHETNLEADKINNLITTYVEVVNRVTFWRHSMQALKPGLHLCFYSFCLCFAWLLAVLLTLWVMITLEVTGEFKEDHKLLEKTWGVVGFFNQKTPAAITED